MGVRDWLSRIVAPPQEPTGPISAPATAATADADSAMALCEQGHALRCKGSHHMEAALACFTKATELDASCEFAWLSQAQILQYLYQYDDAVATYRIALEVATEEADAWLGLGQCLAAIGADAGAAAAFDEFLQWSDPSDYNDFELEEVRTRLEAFRSGRPMLTADEAHFIAESVGTAKKPRRDLPLDQLVREADASADDLLRMLANSGVAPTRGA